MCAQALSQQSAHPAALTCSGCRMSYPVADGRFPDFLSPDDRNILRDEVAFWQKHFPGSTIYGDESPESYREWADLCGLKGEEEILEIGCGSGALLSAMPARLRVGLEPVESLLRPSQGFEGVIGNAALMPFKDAVFDVVYFKHSLHHIVPKEKAFAQAARMVKPGGKLIVIEPNLAHPYRRLTQNPENLLRKYKIVVRFMSPVETFQHAEELIGWSRAQGLALDKLLYRESRYTRLTFKQKLQKIYRRAFRYILPAKYRYPNYFLMFRKP
jgi:SAM-dependent methyltransferase